jgi:hypothetical protein
MTAIAHSETALRRYLQVMNQQIYEGTLPFGITGLPRSRSDALTRTTPREFVEIYARKPGAYLIKYYPRAWQSRIADCLSIAENRGALTGAVNLGFCFAFQEESIKRVTHMT